jgi:hypothetical protein
MCNKSNVITRLKRTIRFLYILQKTYLLSELEPILNETTHPQLKLYFNFEKKLIA